MTGASARINALRMAGNDRAELVLAEGRGHRANGKRHPHTWALVEEGDAVNWMLAGSSKSPGGIARGCKSTKGVVGFGASKRRRYLRHASISRPDPFAVERPSARRRTAPLLAS